MATWRNTILKIDNIIDVAGISSNSYINVPGCSRLSATPHPHVLPDPHSTFLRQLPDDKHRSMRAVDSYIIDN